MGLTGNSVSALPFAQDPVHSPLFLYPALNSTCCFCGWGAAIWSKLCSNVKYGRVGVRYLTYPRKEPTPGKSSLVAVRAPLVVPRAVLLSLCLGTAPLLPRHLPTLRSVPSRSCSLGM